MVKTFKSIFEDEDSYLCIRRNNDLRFFDCQQFDTLAEATNYLKYNCDKSLIDLSGATKIITIPKMLPMFMRNSIIDKKLKQSMVKTIIKNN